MRPVQVKGFAIGGESITDLIFSEPIILGPIGMAPVLALRVGRSVALDSTRGLIVEGPVEPEDR